MLTKIDMRKMIENKKREYSASGNKEILLHVAIMKGMYDAYGGTKYITVPPMYNFVVKSSIIVFTYKNRLKTVGYNKAKIGLIGELLEIGIDTEVCNIEQYISTDNIGISRLLALIILCKYTEDIVINSEAIIDIAFELLENIDEREVNVRCQQVTI